MPQAIVDGRRLRRVRGQNAVLDAMLDLLLETGRVATVPEAAARANVSVSTVYRYFDNMDGLRAELATRTLERFGHLLEIPGLGTGTLDERIAGLVEARAHLHGTTGPIARILREQALELPMYAAALERARQSSLRQVRDHFAPELRALPVIEADDLALAVVTVTAYESWALLCEYGHGPDEIRRAWTATLRRLLAS